MKIVGHAVAPESAHKQTAHLELYNSGMLSCTSNNSIYSGLSSKLERMPSVGRMPTTLIFPSGWSFTFAHNPEFEHWWAQHHSTNQLHYWERKPSFILLALLLTLACAYGFVRFGFPGLSSIIAQQVPEPAYQYIGKSAHEWIDSSMLLSASNLPARQQAAIQAGFAELAATIDVPRELNLQIKSWYDTSNAFAIADGSIVITDDLVIKLGDPQLINAVLLHEIGHIYENHGMQRLVKGSLIAFISAYIVGDVGAVAESMVSVSSAAMMMQYSQQDELQADLFAATYLLQQQGDAQAMIDVLRELKQVTEKAPSPLADAANNDDKESKQQESEQQQQASILLEQLAAWFSTHPGLDERIIALEVVNK